MLRAENLHKAYLRHTHRVPVLRGLDLTLDAGEFVCVLGRSGSGKSTLLHLLGTLDAPDEGRVILDGQRIDTLPARERDRLRNGTFGFVFQFYHLLPELSTLENVLAPAMIGQSLWGYFRNRAATRKRAEELLDRVGLSHRLHHRPNELSGGEMQRAAVARALMPKPRVLLADEPTGNLDEETGAEIVKLLRTLNRDEGLTIALVTHNLDIAHVADRVVKLAAGRLEESPGPVVLRAVVA